MKNTLILGHHNISFSLKPRFWALKICVSSLVPSHLFVCLNTGFRELDSDAHSVTEICQMYGTIKIVFEAYFNVAYTGTSCKRF